MPRSSLHVVMPFRIRQRDWCISNDTQLTILLLLYGAECHIRDVSVKNVLSFIAWRHKDWADVSQFLSSRKDSSQSLL